MLRTKPLQHPLAPVHPIRPPRPRVGLALAAGGVPGVAWQVGALESIRRATGFEPHHAELVVGTSAGAVVGALAATLGIPLAYAHVSGEPGPGVDLADRRFAVARAMDEHLFGKFPFERRVPRPVVSSFAGLRRLAGGGVRSPIGMAVASMLWEGLLSSRGVGRAVKVAFPDGWPTDRLRITSFDLDTASPQVFHAASGHGVGLADALVAATAVPTIFSPVRLAGRRLTDGAVHSITFLEQFLGRGLDLVICLHPLLGQGRGRTLGERAKATLVRPFRRRLELQLEREISALEAEGTTVVVLMPDAHEHARIPANFLDTRSCPDIMRRAAHLASGRLGSDVTSALGRARWAPLAA